MGKKKHIFDRIVYLVIIYIIFAIASLVTIIAVDSFVQKRMLFLRSLNSNETAKNQLNAKLKIKLINVQNYLLNYTNAVTFNEMDFYEKLINEEKKSISDILHILEEGGEFSEEMSVNYKGLEYAEDTVSYEPENFARYNIAVLDLKAKVTDIKDHVDTNRNLIMDVIISRDIKDAEYLTNIYDKKNIAVKSLIAFFKRVDESSNRMFVEAQDSEKIIKEAIMLSEVKFKSAKQILYSVIFLTLALAGAVISFKIFRTVKERTVANRELNRLNNNLESTVKKRTEELEREIAVRIAKEEESVSKADFMMAVLESLEHPFYVIDADTYEIMLANSSAYKIIGSRGSTCYELTHHTNHPCDGLEHPCPLKKVKETGVPTSVEHIHIVKGGEKRYFEIHGYPIKDDRGKVVQMIEYSLDITDKKDAEFALVNLNSMLEERVAERTKELESEIQQRQDAENRVITRESHYRNLIANISDIIVIVDESKRIKYVSPSAETVTGFDSEQLMDKPLEDLIHSRDSQVFKMWIDNIISGKDFERVVEFRIQKRSGKWFHGEAIAKNMLENEIISGVLINIRDITLRKKAEDEIRKLALVMEQNPNSILITDIDAKIEYVNPAFEKITGYNMYEVIGKNPNILKTDHTPPEIFHELWETVTKGKVWKGEFVNKKKNGELYVEHAIISPILNDRGEIINYLGVKENITELKKAREKAEESNQLKSMFLANMSHEIRTPLNGLMGFLELLTQTELTNQQSDYVETIRFSADSLLEVLNDILDLSKIESGMLELEETEMDLGYNILSTAKAFYAKANEKKISMLTYIDPHLPVWVVGDSLRINQVASNLISNAIKFTNSGGTVKVSVELLSERSKSSEVRIAVEDTGVGIPEDKQKAIFDSFAQADSSVTRKFGGTGLGLTICKNLISMMGSEIHIESEEGSGSRFSFELILPKRVSGVFDKTLEDSPRIYIVGKGELSIYSVVERYIRDLSGSCEFIGELQADKNYDGNVLIFNESSFDDEAAERLKSVDAKVIYMKEDFREGVSVEIGDDVVLLKRPFSGRKFFESVTGQVLDKEKSYKSGSAESFVRRYEGDVLLAEDNTINQNLMCSILKRHDLNIDIAENGEKAVELAVKNRYDLIFMDINMPNLDGVSAADQIRERESEEGAERVPIIALTAHTLNQLKSDHSFASFDGYLAKPVQIPELNVFCSKYLKPAEGSESFDYENILSDIGLGKDVYNELASGYLKQLEEDLIKMREFTEEGDYKTLNSLAHSNKGAAENLRLKEMSGFFMNIENSILSKSKDDILRNIDFLNHEIEIILEYLKRCKDE